MKWKEHLKRQLPSNGRWENYEQLYRMCLLAYAEGCNEEKKKALEAYRLRKQVHAVCRQQGGSKKDM